MEHVPELPITPELAERLATHPWMINESHGDEELFGLIEKREQIFENIRNQGGMYNTRSEGSPLSGNTPAWTIIQHQINERIGRRKAVLGIDEDMDRLAKTDVLYTAKILVVNDARDAMQTGFQNPETSDEDRLDMRNYLQAAKDELIDYQYEQGYIKAPPEAIGA